MHPPPVAQHWAGEAAVRGLRQGSGSGTAVQLFQTRPRKLPN